MPAWRQVGKCGRGRGQGRGLDGGLAEAGRVRRLMHVSIAIANAIVCEKVRVIVGAVTHAPAVSCWGGVLFWLALHTLFSHMNIYTRCRMIKIGPRLHLGGAEGFLSFGMMSSDTNVEHGLAVRMSLRDLYCGQFLHGERSGHGIQTGADGSKYMGQWVQGVASGAGVMLYADGQVFAGKCRAGLMEGEGVLWSADGAMYLNGVFTRGVLREGIAAVNIGPGAWMVKYLYDGATQMWKPLDGAGGLLLRMKTCMW